MKWNKAVKGRDARGNRIYVGIERLVVYRHDRLFFLKTNVRNRRGRECLDDENIALVQRTCDTQIFGNIDLCAYNTILRFRRSDVSKYYRQNFNITYLRQKQ